jgi:hypothetical protein
MKVPNVIVRIGRCYRLCLPVHVCFARKADKTGLDSIERFANKIAELPLFPALAVAIGWQFSPERFNNAGKAAVAQPVEQRIRNAWVGGSNPFRGTKSQFAAVHPRSVVAGNTAFYRHYRIATARPHPVSIAKNVGIIVGIPRVTERGYQHASQ